MKKILIAGALVLAAAAPTQAFNPLDAVKGIINEATASDNFEISKLEGKWAYEAPAISFKSDNALNKAGGVAASATIESKLAPYYQKLGLNTISFTFDKDGNFTATVKKITLSGTVSKDGDDGQLTFNFKANNKINLGNVSAAATLSATGQLTLTFDASHVITIVQKVAEFSKNSTLQSVSSLLGSYDGVFAGARFNKSK